MEHSAIIFSDEWKMKIEEAVLYLKSGYYRDELSKKGMLRIKVNGNSMWPFLRNGDIVIVRNVDFEKVSVGDIVLTDIGNNMLCHRVFSKRGNFIVTKADTFIGFDPMISKEGLIGKVIAKEKSGKIYNLDELLSYRIRFFIPRISIISSFCCYILRVIKKAALNTFNHICKS